MYKLHVEIHNSMLDKLNSISEQIQGKQITKPILEKFMGQWIEHICNDDAAVRDYVLSIKSW